MGVLQSRPDRLRCYHLAFEQRAAFLSQAAQSLRCEAEARRLQDRDDRVGGMLGKLKGLFILKLRPLVLQLHRFVGLMRVFELPHAFGGAHGRVVIGLGELFVDCVDLLRKLACGFG